MNSQIIEGNWKVIKGKMRQEWGKLTDSDLDFAKGNFDEVVGRLQKAYGYSKEKAQAEFQKFKERNLSLIDDITHPETPKTSTTKGDLV